MVLARGLANQFFGLAARLQSGGQRRILGQPHGLAQWAKLKRGVTSELTEVECLRTLDRLAASGALRAGDVPERRAAVFDLLAALDVIGLRRPVLARAGQPFPTPLGTLDAIHLASALLWAEQAEEPLTLATHDTALATAARAMGLEVVGA